MLKEGTQSQEDNLLTTDLLHPKEENKRVNTSNKEQIKKNKDEKSSPDELVRA